MWVTMQAALKARHPDSLPALIAAAKPSPQESALVTDLQTKLRTLQVPLMSARMLWFGCSHKSLPHQQHALTDNETMPCRSSTCLLLLLGLATHGKGSQHSALPPCLSLDLHSLQNAFENMPSAVQEDRVLSSICLQAVKNA